MPTDKIVCIVCGRRCSDCSYTAVVLADGAGSKSAAHACPSCMLVLDACERMKAEGLITRHVAFLVGRKTWRVLRP